MAKILSNEYTARKGDVELYVFQKRLSKSTKAQRNGIRMTELLSFMRRLLRTSATIRGQSRYRTR